MLENRSYKERILLSGALLGVIVLTPFAIYRLLSGDYLIALLEITLMVAAVAVFIYVWRTTKTTVAGLILGTLVLGITVAIIHIKDTSLVYWLYPSTLATFCIMHHRTASVLNLIAIFIAFPAIYPKLGLHEVIVIYSSLCLLSLSSYIFTIVNQNQRDQLSQLAERDALTGALNRRSLDENMLVAINNLSRNNSRNKSLIILDLDHFKSINDTYGHSTGDEILIRIARLIRSNIRLSDRLFRYGGEEFVILVDNATIYEAQTLAESIRERVERSNIFNKKVITISLGIAELTTDLSTDCWLKLADEALYEAKRTGRNKVCIAAKQSKLATAA